jgi:23S rRNA (pseudouridine1915-N3)-methyltransferase
MVGGQAARAPCKDRHRAVYQTPLSLFSGEWQIIPPPKSAGLSQTDQKVREASIIRALLKEGDYLVALDEGGTALTSEGLSAFIQQRASGSSRRVVFLIGGAYGIDQTILKEASFRWSLSPLTFPHQLVRLILSEQLYRACTILRNENTITDKHTSLSNNLYLTAACGVRWLLSFFIFNSNHTNVAYYKFINRYYYRAGVAGWFPKL